MAHNFGYEMPNVFDKIFMGKRAYAKRSYRGGGSHIRHQTDGTLDHAAALHWVLHTAHGHALINKLNLPPGEIADLLVQAAQMRTTNKQKATNMTSNQRFLKNLRHMGEHGMTAFIQKHADSVRLPSETSAQAFTRIFTDAGPEGVALRTLYDYAKANASNEAEDVVDEAEAERRRRRRMVDDQDGDEAMETLELRAAALRKTDPTMTKEQAFTKAYLGNPELAARERRAAMRKLGVQ
jgi:hypothetical protein